MRFVAKRRSKKSKKLTWPTLPAWAQMQRGRLIGGRLLGVGAIVVLIAWGVPRLSVYANTRAAPRTMQVKFDQAPAWLRGDLLTTLQLTVATQLGTDPFNQNDLAAARHALLETGWFQTIDQVRRRRPDVIEVDAVFVHPFAVVRSGPFDYLVDPTAHLLPRSYPAGEAHPKFVTIIGTHFDRPTRPGIQWPGADVAAALSLLHLLDQRPWRNQLAEVDVSRYLTDQEIEIVTDRGCRLRWGSAPGEEISLEAMADLKLRYLDEHYELSHRIDRGHVGTLDLTRREGVFATE
jgi:hypothetical protein